MSDWQNTLAGRFVVLDGPDGAGKTTQLRLLAEDLGAAGVEAVCVRDPGGTAIGDRIRGILLDPACGEMAVACETMLYMASRAQLVEQVIRPALSRGACVLSDRYVSSTIAYQGAGGQDTEAVRRVAEVAIGGLWPDLTVVLDLDHEAGLHRSRLRGQLDRMESKDLDFHRRVRAIFLDQARGQGDRFAVVDADAPVEAVHERIVAAVAAWAGRQRP